MHRWNKLLMTAVCAAAMLAAGSASAGDSQTMTVSATVLSVCKFTSSAYTMPFANISPESAADVTRDTTISYKCTKGTTPLTFTFDGGSTGTSVNLIAGSNTLPVSLTWPAPTAGNGFGSAAAVDVVVTGTITAANFNLVPAATYTKSVTVAITP